MDALVLYSTCSMPFVNQTYDMVFDNQFQKFYSKPFTRVLCNILTTHAVGAYLGCYRGKQDDFTGTITVD